MTTENFAKIYVEQKENKTYKQHQAAFSNVSAYVILKDGERVATIAFKFPKDGAGRLYVYVHYFGFPMVRGFASGYGYDKKSTAVEDAIDTLINSESWIEKSVGDVEGYIFTNSLTHIGGSNWDRALETNGFTVLQAV